MFDKCIRCDRLGKDCIPNICIMTVNDAREWAKKLKDYKRISNAELAKESCVPKGTIDMHFAKKTAYSADTNYSTFAPIFCALIGCDKKEMPCPQKPNCKYTDADVDIIKEEYEERIEYLKQQIFITQKISAGRMKAIIILAVFLGMTLLLVIFALLIDAYSLDLGFIWRNK